MVYTVSEIKSMTEYIANTLNSGGSLLQNQDSQSSTFLDSENIPIRNEQTLVNVETELESASIRTQVVSLSEIST